MVVLHGKNVFRFGFRCAAFSKVLHFNFISRFCLDPLVLSLVSVTDVLRARIFESLCEVLPVSEGGGRGSRSCVHRQRHDKQKPRAWACTVGLPLLDAVQPRDGPVVRREAGHFHRGASGSVSCRRGCGPILEVDDEEQDQHV